MTQLYQSYIATISHQQSIYDQFRVCQTFISPISHTLEYLKLAVYRYGAGNTIIIDIYLAGANHKPTGSILSTCTKNCTGIPTAVPTELSQYTQFDLSPQIPLTANLEYCIVAREYNGDSNNHTRIIYNSTGYANGYRVYSADSGASWTVDTGHDFPFAEYGTHYDLPTVITNEPTGLTHNAVTLHGTLSNDGGKVTKVRFNYGLDENYGTNTAWQEGKYTNDTFEQALTNLTPETTYHFRVEANNEIGTSYSAGTSFTTTPAPIQVGIQIKVLITHPSIKEVKVIQAGQVQSDYEQLSNLGQGYIENSLEIPVPTPCTIEITTLADQVFCFDIPLTS
jgi:hypothetical protein